MAISHGAGDRRTHFVSGQLVGDPAQRFRYQQFDSVRADSCNSQKVPELVGVLLRKNYGQTAAMAAGFDVARGRVIVSLDGDLQNDPADIPLLLAKLREGYDLVSGWRHQRQDAELQRKLPSRIANRLIGRVTGVKLRDRSQCPRPKTPPWSFL